MKEKDGGKERGEAKGAADFRSNPLWQLLLAGAVVVIILAAVLIPKKEKEEPAAPVGEQVKYVTILLPYADRGPLALIDEGHPQSLASLREIGQEAIPAGWHAASGYATTGNNIRLLPLPLMQLDRMVLSYTGSNAVYSVPCLTSGFLGEQEQSASDGIGLDPAGGGYSCTLSLVVPSGDTMTPVPLTSPLAQPFSAWLLSHAASFGFVVSGGGNLLYVGIPHAQIMTRYSLSLAGYIELLSGKTETAPLTEAASGHTYSIYYVPAERNGTAEISLPEGSVFTASGTNTGGFIVTVLSD